MPNIEKDQVELKASSQIEFANLEERLLKQKADEGWELTGTLNPLPYFCTYFFIRDNTQKKQDAR